MPGQGVGSYSYLLMVPPRATELKMTRLQAWREDRTLIAATDLILEVLGPQFVESVPLHMERVYDESAPTRPVICLLSPGAMFMSANKIC